MFKAFFHLQKQGMGGDGGQNEEQLYVFDSSLQNINNGGK